MRLADAEGLGDLLTQGQALAEAVAGGLGPRGVGVGDAGQHGGGDQVAFEGQRRPDDGGGCFAGHVSPRPGVG